MGITQLFSLSHFTPYTFSIAVYSLLAFEWAQTSLVTANAFDIFVYHFGDISIIPAFLNSWFSVPIMCSVVATVAQIFFAWRIHGISMSRYLAGIIVMVSQLKFPDFFKIEKSSLVLGRSADCGYCDRHRGVIFVLLLREANV